MMDAKPDLDRLRRLLDSALAYDSLVDPLSPRDVLQGEPTPEQEAIYRRWREFERKRRPIDVSGEERWPRNLFTNWN